jgi:hypothetical protein
VKKTVTAQMRGIDLLSVIHRGNKNFVVEKQGVVKVRTVVAAK